MHISRICTLKPCSSYPSLKKVSFKKAGEEAPTPWKAQNFRVLVDGNTYWHSYKLIRGDQKCNEITTALPELLVENTLLNSYR
jgi:hypothetical protein